MLPEDLAKPDVFTLDEYIFILSYPFAQEPTAVLENSNTGEKLPAQLLNMIINN